MDKLKSTIVSLLTMLVITVGIAPAALAIDEAKVPHYFGPAPNWALSPLPVVNPDGTISGGIRKFVDGLPRLGPGGANNLGQYIPVAVPDTTTYPGSDYYEIGLVQYQQKMHSDLPPTQLRGYVQLSTNVVPGAQVPLANVLLDGTAVPIAGYKGVDSPHYLGPIIVATKDKPVRILFRNLLPTGAGGDLFLPVDSTLMGSGMGPMPMVESPDLGLVTDEVRNQLCSQSPKSEMCFKDNRATLHLHGGITPWISDGTPHQWITPADENTPWPKGVAVRNVPDMPDPGPGAMTFFYTNQQSARLMFYHDHAWGITRLNVYAGEAAGYLITDDTEKSLLSRGLIPGAADTIPLIVQDRTFVPPGDKTTRTGQLYDQDPTWDESRWGGFGNFWYHHVYMPAQNPGDPGGMSAYGRWMYGPWFWPPAKDALFGPIANPRHNMDPATNFTTPLSVPCNIDDPATWQYQVDPFCEPEMIPGTPNISAGMEQFNDTPLVNGTPYPTTTVDPKTYRLRILNAANDRFFNLQMYVADSTGTEVAFKADELAAAQVDPVVFPTPDTNVSPAGPNWIQIGTEGGFLPAPVVIPSQPITWITDPTRFDVGNVDQHSLLLAPAERADVIVDFSKYAGKTLILYNDAPAAFPARVSTYDYYTGSPDLSPNGAPGVLPGYGPNTRTVMQIKVAAGTPAPAFDLAALEAAFAHQSDGTGVFESGQHPIIVGQAAYNSAYGTNFAASSWCNGPRLTTARCDGFARISDQGGDLFGFNTLLAPLTKLQIPLQPKAIHDEMNSVSFDEFGRMTANLGIETVPATPGNQNVTLYPYTNPVTELIDATNLPKNTSVTPITAQDGTQLWKITHNGVDTHPIHFHLYDVQVVNRVTWDNIVLPPDTNELGWKDTVRISPLQDTIVALRPVIPTLPFEIPNSIHTLNPMMPVGSTLGFNNIDIQGNPTAPITNQLVNFGWEYVFHCHILSHEEMDMMRPVSVALPPKQPDGLLASVNGPEGSQNLVISWNDNSITETAFVVEKTSDGATWTTVGTSLSPLDEPNTIGIRSLADPDPYDANAAVTYRVVAQNTIGYGGEFPSMTVSSVSDQLVVGTPPSPSAPGQPTLVTAVAGNGQATISFAPPAFNGGSAVTSYTVTSTPGNLTQTGAASPITITGLTNGTAYTFTVSATNAIGTGLPSAASNQVTPATVPGAPSIGAVTPGDTKATVTFTPPVSNGGSAILYYTVTSDPGGITATGTADPIVVTGLTNATPYTFTVTATNAMGTGAPSAASAPVTPLGSFPGAPTIGTATPGPGQATVSFTPPLSDGGLPIIEYIVTSSPGNFTAKGIAGPLTVTGLTNGTAYTFTVAARNISATGPASAPSNSVVPVSVPGAPTIGPVIGGNGTATVYFTPSAFNSGTPDIVYTVTSNTGVKTTGIVSPIMVTGLTNGTAYTFTVTTLNAVGTSAPSAPAGVTPATVPDAPVGVAAVAADRSAVVTFTAPASNGGSPLGLYTVTVSPGSQTVQALSSPVTVTGLTNGAAYSFTVTASNTTGTGPASAPSNSVVPVSVPGAPTIDSVTAGAGDVTVSFTPSAFNSGTPTIIYTVTANTGAKATGSASPITVAGLTNGTVYTFTVTATNAVGTSPPSAPSASITPATVPGAPTGISAVAGNTAAVVTYTPPVSNGGSTIISYMATAYPGGRTAQVATGPITVTGLTNGINYTFTVTATNAIGTSAPSLASNIVTATATAPAAPARLTATASAPSASPPTVTLTWQDRSFNEGGFILERATNTSFSAGFVRFTLGPNTTTYTDTAVVARTRYYYRVRAFNAIGASANTGTVNVLPRQLPADPTNAAVAGTAVVTATRSSITLSWTDNAANETGFYVQRATSANGPWSRIATVAANTATAPAASTYTNTGLTRNRTYWYRIQAYNADGTSGFTAPVSGTTP